jgi:hypothetical protein
LTLVTADKFEVNLLTGLFHFGINHYKMLLATTLGN